MTDLNLDLSADALDGQQLAQLIEKILLGHAEDLKAVELAAEKIKISANTPGEPIPTLLADYVAAREAKQNLDRVNKIYSSKLNAVAKALKAELDSRSNYIDESMTSASIKIESFSQELGENEISSRKKGLELAENTVKELIDQYEDRRTEAQKMGVDPESFTAKAAAKVKAAEKLLDRARKLCEEPFNKASSFHSPEGHSASVSLVKKFLVYDLRLVPVEFLTVKKKELDKALKDDPKIPGVRPTETTSLNISAGSRK